MGEKLPSAIARPRCLREALSTFATRPKTWLPGGATKWSKTKIGSTTWAPTGTPECLIGTGLSNARCNGTPAGTVRGMASEAVGEFWARAKHPIPKMGVSSATTVIPHNFMFSLEIPLSPINQNAKRSRNGHTSRMGLVGRGGRSGSKICGVQKEVVGLGVKPHGFGAELGLDRLDLAEFVRRVLVEHVDHAIAGRGENHAGVRVISGGVHTTRYRKRLDNLAAVGVHRHQHLGLAAGAEYPPVPDVDCQRRGLARGSNRPSRLDRERAGIQGYDLAFTFHIDIKSSLAVGNRKFRFPAQLDSPHDLAALGINHRRAFGVSVHDEYTLRDRIVDDAIGVVIGFRLADHFEGLGIEDDHFSLSAVADEAAAKLAGQCYPVVLFQAGDIADQGARIGVDNFNLGAMRQVDAPCRRVDRDIIEILPCTTRCCTKGVFLEQVITAPRGNGQSR